MKRLIPLLLSLATALALTPASNAQYYPPAGNPNAVAPSGTPATGDTVYYNGSAWVRLAHAADGTVMVLASGIPSWTALSAGIPVPSSPATGSILWYNGTAWIASLNGLFGSGVTDNGTIQLGNNTNSVSGVLVIQSGGATGQGVITYPGTANKNFIMPTVNYTGLTALPGSTLPLLISSLGVESTGALSYAQGGTGATSFTNHTLVTAGASSLGGITPGTAGHVPRSNATDYVDAQLGLSDLSGTVQAAQFPILTGDITTAGGALATTLKNTGPGAGSCTNCSATIDAQGRVTALSTGAGGSGTVNSGTTPRLAYYASSTTAVSDTGAGLFFTSPATLVIGAATVGTGVLNLAGTTSGTTALTVPAAAGAVTITLPTVTTTGPTANPASNNIVLVSSTGGTQSYASQVIAINGAIQLGASGGNAGNLQLNGSTSGNASIQPAAAAAGTGIFTLPVIGQTVSLVPVGGNGSDSAGTIGTSTVEGQAFNYTTLTTTSGLTSQRPGCNLNTTGQITLVSTSVLTANGAGAAQTGVGIAAAGGNGATAATSAGDAGYGIAPGEPGNNNSLIGPGGGAGAAASGGAGGGATVASGDGQPGLCGGGTSHYGGTPNGSGGGGGGSGAGGTGGNGGGGGNHLTIIAAGGFTGTGSVTAPGSAGAAGGTLGSGGAGGGAGSLWIYSGTGNLPAATFSAIGGAGGTSVSTAANSGGGGAGYIGGSASGTIASATFTVTGGAAGTGGGGTAGTAGGTGLANMRASIAPTLPQITFDHLNGDSAGKNMCWILLARKAIRGEDYESEKSHIFIWDGEKGQTSAPLSYIAATYAAPGKFSELCMALHFGGDASTASLCDSSNRDQCVKMFDTFKDSPIKGEMPIIESTCDDTEFLRPSV